MTHRNLDHTLVYKARLGVTFLIGISQAIMAILALYSRLSESTGSQYALFYILTDDRYWAGAFTIASVIVFMGFKQYRLHPISMSVSSGLLLVWGVLTVGDIVTSPIDSLPIISGILSIALGIVAFFMSQIWNVILWDIKYNHHTLAEAGAQVIWKG